jgi:hypothetical protein
LAEAVRPHPALGFAARVMETSAANGPASERGRASAGLAEADYACAGPPYNPNTYSIDAVDVYLSSGALAMAALACLEPTSTATYCLPLTE